MIPSDPAQLPPARLNQKAIDHQPSALAKMNRHADWTDRQWQEYLHVYGRLVEIADRDVGRVLDALDKSGLTGNTIVLFTSDHGEMMGSHQMFHKQRLYDEAAAVPLILAGPDTTAHVDQTHLISGLDVLPTLLDYAGIAAPPTLLGKSLKPLVTQQAVPWRDYVVSETSSAADARMVRTAKYKYILFALGENREQFFDREADPGETKNLAGDPTVKVELERHQALLKEWMRRTKDEFGKGGGGKKKKAVGKETRREE
jgi:choline-sulfatase